VVIIIVYLEWGSSSSSNTHSFWAELNNIYFYTKKMPHLEGPRLPQFRFMLGLELGGPKAGIRLCPGGDYVG
jgi:hypothetical protein